jgi:hypothetical protein
MNYFILKKLRNNLTLSFQSRSGLTWHRTSLKSKNLKDQKNTIYPAVCGLTPE